MLLSSTGYIEFWLIVGFYYLLNSYNYIRKVWQIKMYPVNTQNTNNYFIIYPNELINFINLKNTIFIYQK